MEVESLSKPERMRNGLHGPFKFSCNRGLYISTNLFNFQQYIENLTPRPVTDPCMERKLL